MKCLHVLPMNNLSGAEKLTLILCKNMKEYKPIVVCGGNELKSIFENEGIQTYVIDFANNNIIKSTKQLKNIVKEQDIKIIHAHDNNASVTSYIAKKLYNLNVKVISHIHSCYPWLEGKTKTKKIDTFFRKRYDHNIACGKLVYDYYTKHTNYINNENTTILSNAIDIDEIKKYADINIDDIYLDFNIPKDKIILGFIGRLAEPKGIIPFLNKLSNYKDRFEDCIFLLVGDGPQEIEVKELIKKLGLEDLFIFTGHQDNVYRFYPIIDIFFLPSIYEGLPMVILEAMSFGKPIISMDVGSINEVIRDDYNGSLIRDNDLDKFINTLCNLKHNSKKRSMYSYNATKTIESNYNINVYNKNISNLYDRMLIIDEQ